MRAVILAGGNGTRLAPLTNVVNKHLLPVGRKPMIQYSLEHCAAAGIKEVLLVTGELSAALFTRLYGSGSSCGLHLMYRIQDRPMGVAAALLLAEGFIRRHDRFVVLLGDNLFDDSLHKLISPYREQQKGARVILKEVPDGRAYGVPIIENDRIVKIEEKPAHPQSSYCVTGIYCYDGGVFDIIRTLKPSKRGELEITDVNNVYAKRGELTYGVMRGWWVDAGTFDSLYDASNRLIKQEDERT